MDRGEYSNHLEETIKLVNERLAKFRAKYNDDNAPYQQSCPDAMWYSLSAGGKRIRPVLLMEFCRIFGGSAEKALDSACAIEMIHTFSLIHDDLPCMDDDDYRRGKPSCHKQFGEAQALLAGDALECLAFEIIAADENVSFEQRVKLIQELSREVGVCGMIGGQIIDTCCTDEYSDERLLKMYALKTSALIEAACVMGCICAEAYDKIPFAREYACALGLAFQITDDILDITLTSEVLGKPIGSDADLGKQTYAAVHGVEAAAKKAEELTQAALDIAESFPDNEFIVYLTNDLLGRKF